MTGSSYVLTSGSGQSILIDLGMFQGGPDIEKLNYLPFDYDPSQLSAALLTHAHLDHCGRLPIIVPKGFAGYFWMTAPTLDLTELSLLDSAKIAQEDQKQVLYDKELVAQVVKRFVTTSYHQKTTLGDFSVVFRDAGHILGSAILEIEDLKPDSEYKKIVFSGDLGNSPEALLAETETIGSSDVVVMESTYGDRLHPKDNPMEILLSEIKKIQSTSATLLIPAFSLERTQELLHMIMHLKKINQIARDLPVFLDSPMAEKATTIYTHYPQIFNSHIRDDIKIGDPFDFEGLKYTKTRAESQAIHDVTGAKIIMAGSGMMAGGRIVSHAAFYLPDSSARFLIVGFQGEGTLGRQLLEGAKNVDIYGQNIQVSATISNTQAMSSHADQSQLMAWLSHIRGVKKVILTHGEDVPRMALAEKIKSDLAIQDISLPTLNQEILC